MEPILGKMKRVGRKVKKEAKAAFGDPQMQDLKKWQERLERARQSMGDELALMDRREDLYAGSREIQKAAGSKARGPAKQATTVRNIVAELIDTQVDSNIPQPAMTPLDIADDRLAQSGEQMLKTDINRLPVEYLNDEQERTNPIQGGSWVLVEWDNTIRTHTTIGDTTLTLLHPKQVFLQPGVKDYRKTNWAIIQFAVTKDYIKRRFDKDVDDETESNPEVNAASLEKGTKADTDNVTLNMAYYLNDNNGVGLFAWVNDAVVEDMEDYLCRRQRVCKKCNVPMVGTKCPECGEEKYKEVAQEYEELTQDVVRSDGTAIPAMSPELDELGRPILDELTGQPRMVPTRLPFYRINQIPLVLRKNVSVFGKLLGESDVDRIADMQERIKKLGTKIDEKLLKGGSVLTKMAKTSFDTSDSELRILNVKSADEAAAVQVRTLQPNISYDASEIQSARYAAKETLGITDSFQGQPDQTATSGVAKQFAAQQSAGRLESKRRMKDAAWADIYALMFKLKLAYADEPRKSTYSDVQGKRSFSKFNRYDYAKLDAAGEWYFEDNFFFSVDSSSGLSTNRQAMWQETRMNYQVGAFGQPGSPEAVEMFWSIMEKHHYPGAELGKAKAQENMEKAQEQQKAQQQQQMMLMQQKANAESQKAGASDLASQAAMVQAEAARQGPPPEQPNIA